MTIAQRKNKCQPPKLQEENVQIGRNLLVHEDNTEDSTEKDQHVVKETVEHTVRNSHILYCVRWYGYFPDRQYGQAGKTYFKPL